jgi:hypothetical protein
MNKTEIVHLRIDSETKRAIDKIAKAERRKISAQCQLIFEAWLAHTKAVEKELLSS